MVRKQIVIKFRSLPSMYRKEESDLKNNTLRRVEMYDAEKYPLLVQLVAGGVGHDPKIEYLIEITNTGTGEKFKRQLRDVSLWEGWFIITWSPKNTIVVLEGGG